ncbi:helix-turn-helix domain-containing protein [Streptomyces sp. NPDC057638]|uniref:helix-turn-helix domain-containing protein n=1 Tax=Streptomyces sp. NPDC057638 TaxID=3346190 RepID=UPI003685C836
MANETLRGLRHKRRWTQAQAAARVCAQVRATTGRDPELDSNWISRLERGVITWPSGDYRKALCTVFQVACEGELGLFPRELGLQEKKTYSVVRTGEVISSVDDIELSSRLGRYAAQTNVSALVLEQFDADVERLARDFVSQPLSHLIPQIRTARAEVFRLLEGRQHPGQTQHLYVIAGWLCGLAAHASLDLGDRPSASTHARTVVQCAEITGHSKLMAWVRSFQSLVAYWAGDYERAAALARAGCEQGGGPGPGTVTARLLSLEARALAARGDGRSALRSLTLAHAARNHELPDSPSGIFSFPEAKQWAYSGTTLLAVGGTEHVQRAITASHRAVALYEAGPVKDRSPGDLHAAHLDLATAYLASGEIEGASRELSEVLGAGQYTASITIRLRNLDAYLGHGSYRDAQAAGDLRERIRGVTGRPALTPHPTESS